MTGGNGGRAPRTLDSIDRETMLRNAWRIAPRRFVESRFLWGFVKEVCGVGSTSAKAICRELGWDPFAEEIPVRSTSGTSTQRDAGSPRQEGE